MGRSSIGWRRSATSNTVSDDSTGKLWQTMPGQDRMLFRQCRRLTKFEIDKVSDEQYRGILCSKEVNR